MALSFGYVPTYEGFHKDMEPEFLEIYKQCKGTTMTSIERMYALYCSVNHIVRNQIPGAFVECGVWRGGSAMLCALTLLARGDNSRELFLYDTYAGMTEPTDVDRELGPFGRPDRKAHRRWAKSQEGGVNAWCYASLEDVTENLSQTGYPLDKLKFVEGVVEETIPGVAPAQVAILRLDTDWYESTRHELEHLYPRLSRDGVLIIDDYGHWQGAKKATDEYFGGDALLLKVDYTARIGIKLADSPPPG